MTIKDKVIIQMLKEIAVTQLLVTITMALPSLLTVSLYEHWNDLLIIIIFLLNVIEGAMLYFLYGYGKRGEGMTIDGSIKELSKWRNDLNYDNGDYCYGDFTTKHSLDVAIATMRKYQKIEKIVKLWESDSWTDGLSYDCMIQISEVIEDGNDN